LIFSADTQKSDLQLVDLTSTRQGLDLKFRNIGADSAFVHHVWLLFEPNGNHGAPCEADIPSNRSYDYPFSVTLAQSTVNLDTSAVRKAAASIRSDDEATFPYRVAWQLKRLLKRAGRTDALDGVHWAESPISVSQEVPPHGVDRFLVRIVPEPPWQIGSECDGGRQYHGKLVVAYDNSKVLVSDPFRFTLTIHPRFTPPRDATP
jgi:hypothetical protein